MRELIFSIDLVNLTKEPTNDSGEVIPNFTYRLYIDNDLITERTWIWGDSKFIRERIPLCLTPGKHTFKVETPQFHPSQVVLRAGNTQANDVPVPRFTNEFIIE